MLCLVWEVSVYVIDVLLNIIESFNEFEMCVFDFFKSNVCFIFLSLQNQIFRCEKVVLEYRKNLFIRLFILLLVVRSGDEEEKFINDVFDEVVLFFFYQIYLLIWIS